VTVHEPVLLREVLLLLQPKGGQCFVDGTFGGGGHALALAEAVQPDGLVVGLDWDAGAVNRAPKHSNLKVVHSSYVGMLDVLRDLRASNDRCQQVNGILLDLGLSSDQLDDEGRGFSVEDSGPLDLRFDPTSDRPTGAELLATLSEQELTDIFRNYGDEPLARPIARLIVDQRKTGQRIETAEMLVQLVSALYRRRFSSRSRRHPATRVFQALRVAVNDEFGNISMALPRALELLAPGGRLAVISFHSGEDRLVKHWMRDVCKRDEPVAKLITRKPVVAERDEQLANPRSRSAKLRVIEKL